MLRPSDAELEAVAIKADDEGLRLGEEPKQRAFLNVMRMLSILGVDNVVVAGPGAPPIVRRVKAANNKLFRDSDKQSGGIHLDLFMFRDLFARVHIPVAFGRFKLDPWSLIDLSEFKKKWLASDESMLSKFEDQALDLLDFAWGFMEFGHYRPANGRSIELIYRAHVQLEAAAATATGANDFRGTLQNALLGAELAIKAGLANHDFDDEQLRGIGHNLSKGASALAALEPTFDCLRVTKAASTFPNFANSRYGGPDFTRQEIGEIVMKSQYIASEITRTFTTRDFRRDSGVRRARSYP